MCALVCVYVCVWVCQRDVLEKKVLKKSFIFLREQFCYLQKNGQD